MAVIALVGCGNVSARPDSGGDHDDGAAPAAGSFRWQRNMFGSFPTVALAGDQLYVGATQFAALDLGSGILVPAGGSDLMFAHYTTDGVLRSAWRHGGASNEAVLAIAIDPFGNPAVGVLYDGVGTANVGGKDLPAAPATSFEGVAASFTDAGMQRWEVPLTATNQLFPRMSSTNSTGLTAVTGSFNGTLAIGGNNRASVGNDIFYAAFDDKGAVANVTTFGGAGEDFGNAVIFDPLNTVILVGTFTGKVAFGSFTLDAGTGSDMFVVRMTPQGTPMWAIQGGGTGDVGATLAATTPAGDIVVAAAYTGSLQMTGGDTVTAVGASDIALVRVSSAGKVVWTKSFGGAGPDVPRDVAVGRGGEIAMTGEFEAQVSFGGETFTAVGGQDSFVAKYTADGAHLWSHAAGSAAVDRGLGVAVDATGAVYETVSFHGTIDFGGGALSAAGSDYGGVLIKFDP